MKHRDLVDRLQELERRVERLESQRARRHDRDKAQDPFKCQECGFHWSITGHRPGCPMYRA